MIQGSAHRVQDHLDLEFVINIQDAQDVHAKTHLLYLV